MGLRVGMATAAVCLEAVAFDDALPAGRSRAEQLALAAPYRYATLAATPWLVDEIDGAAEGAGVHPLALFAASIEAFLSDHATSPSICRHDDATERSVTVFWCLADVTAGEVRYGRGPCCRGEEATYRFR